MVKDGKQKGPTGKRHRVSGIYKARFQTGVSLTLLPSKGGYDPRAPVVDERGRDLASTQRIGSTVGLSCASAHDTVADDTSPHLTATTSRAEPRRPCISAKYEARSSSQVNAYL